MIQGLVSFFGGLEMAFGDIRIADRADWLIDRIAATGSVVIRKVGQTRAGEMAVHRFLSSPYVSVENIVETLAERTSKQCAGRRILVVQDTTEINFAGRDKKRRNFGAAGNGRDAGFFIHPVIAIDLETEAVVGLVDAAIWTRPKQRAKPRRDRPLEDKESMRWLNGCQAAAASLQQTASLTMVADRESDIYQLFTRKPAGIELIVRAAQDRKLAPDGPNATATTNDYLLTALSGHEPLTTSQVSVPPRGPGDKGRIAQVELRADRVRIARPNHRSPDQDPEAIELTLVEAREIDPPPGKKPLVWHLLTTHPAANAAQAREIVQLYRLRWRIEQVFRALKSDGLALDDSQLIDAERMFNLTVVALAGAIRTIQLVDARDGSPRPASDVIDDAFAPALQKLSAKLEGKTLRQKNPHPLDSLAFVAWIAARLGGWNCYYKPPGPKTMRDGWNQLAATLEGYALALEGKNP